MSDDARMVIDEYGVPYIELSPELRARFDLHDWQPATAGQKTCARCGAVVTLDTLADIGACLSQA